MLTQEPGVRLGTGQTGAVDTALLAGTHADGLAIHCVADGVGLGVLQGDQGDDQVTHGGIRQILGLRHDIREQLPVDFKVVAALFEGDAEHLLALLHFGHVVGIDLNDVVVALALLLQDLQGFGLIAGGDDAVGHFPLDHLGGGHVAHVAQGNPVAEGAHTVCAAGTGISAGQGRIIQTLDIIHKAGLLQIGGKRNADCGGSGAHVLEAGHSGHAQGSLQFLHQLPAVEGIQEVDETGTAGQDFDRQLAAVAHVDLRGLLVGVAAILEFEFFHDLYLLFFLRSPLPMLRSPSAPDH